METENVAIRIVYWPKVVIKLMAQEVVLQSKIFFDEREENKGF